MPNYSLSRDLHEVGSSRTASYLLQSLFIAELIRPSKRLWIVSPWISDIDLIDNTARQFSSICPDWPTNHIRLSTSLVSLMNLGVQVILIVNLDSHNNDFIARMRNAIFPSSSLIIIRSGELHEKGILGSYFTLNGSMNLTFNGVYINDEYLMYRCDQSSIEQRKLELENRWREYLCS